ncbi:hypothetical protein SDC9_170596 [bioreactor metagenome]|uniref:Uncharacterized protein n=1 Tax=bioreactor metagenome TaxID=1076179 RepID=A0A645G8I7_9ZZZZ
MVSKAGKLSGHSDPAVLKLQDQGADLVACLRRVGGSGQSPINFLPQLPARLGAGKEQHGLTVLRRAGHPVFGQCRNQGFHGRRLLISYESSEQKRHIRARTCLFASIWPHYKNNCLENARGKCRNGPFL